MANTKKMLVEDWIHVPSNPIQRNTERHAARAKHLLTPHPTHSVVHAAELPTGKLIKLDGHTRALLWARKQVAAPMQVTVVCYPAKDMAEVEQLYKDFDSRDALETNHDKVSGAFGRHHFEPKSDMLKSGQITYALRIAYGMLLGLAASSSMSPGNSKNEGTKTKKVQKVDIYTMINEFSYELHALDAFELGRSNISSGVMAAFIVSFRRYGHKSTPFWQGVFGGMGAKHGGRMDAIQALCELQLARKGHYGGKNAADICARSLMALEKWLKDEWMLSIPRPLDTTDYLVGHEKPNERLIKKVDLERARIDRERAPARA